MPLGLNLNLIDLPTFTSKAVMILWISYFRCRSVTMICWSVHIFEPSDILVKRSLIFSTDPSLRIPSTKTSVTAADPFPESDSILFR